MEESVFKFLPEEVILNIFKFLDQTTLKDVSQVCKTFHEISNEVPWTMKLTHVNQVGKDEDWCEILKSCNKRFTKIKIDEMLELGKNHMTEMLEKYGGLVEELHLINCVLDDADIFKVLLKAMPKLKKVIMLETSTLAVFRDLEPDDDDVPKFEKLETLEMVKCEYRILEYFKAAQLSTFKVLDSLDGSRQPLQPLTDFLKTQKSLKAFALRSISAEESHLFKVPFEPQEIPFKLQKLSLLDFKLRHDPNDYNNLLKFLLFHVKTLEELEIGRNFPDFVYEFIFSKLKKLKTLKVSMRGLPANADFYERLEPNTSIKKLIISDDSQCGDFEGFIQRLPNLDTIVILDDFAPEAFRVIAARCGKLRHLEVAEMKGTFSELVFPALERLRVDFVFEEIEWSRFVANIPKLKELHMKTVETNYVDIDEITSNLKLEVLRFGANFITDVDFFNAIRRNANDLKLLVLHRESVGIDISETVDIRPLRFHSDTFNLMEFPRSRHGELWNESEYNDQFPDEDINSFGFDGFGGFDDEDAFEGMDAFELEDMLHEMGIINLDDEDDDFDVDDEDYENDYEDFQGYLPG